MKRKIVFTILIASLIFIGKVQAKPLIVNDELITVADDHAIFTWDTTNETGSSGIRYGLITPNIPYEDPTLKSYHYLVLNNLYPNTTYYYQIFSTNANGTGEGIVKSFTTLSRPTGQYLFTFATLTDLHYSPNQADSTGARGRPYAESAAIINAEVAAINQFNPSFTIIKGDLLDKDVSPKNPTATNALKGILDQLTSAAGMSKYYPIPGNHDKAAPAYSSGDWVTSNLGILYPAGSATPVGSSTFNYFFTYNGYRFIMLDSVNSDGTLAQVNLSYLETELQNAKNNNQKAFVIMHHEATEEADVPNEILASILDKSSFDPNTDWDGVRIQNKTTFFNDILNNYKLNNGEPVVAGVLMGHLHDNRRRDYGNVPFVRTSSGLQFPTAFNVYKVYTNGYIQSFYKVPGYSDDISRNLITGTTQITASRLQQAYLGGLTSRNFTFTYNPTTLGILSVLPQNGTSNVALNQPIIINFAKAISNQSIVDQWLTITYDGGTSFPISSSNWSWNSAGTTLTISKTLIASKTFSVTVKSGASGAVASDGTTLSADYTFAFSTGTTTSGTPPFASVDRIKNSDGVITDVTTDPTPTLTGVATDSSGSTIANVEFRYASDNWSNWFSTTPLDGAFDSASEAFIFTIPQGLGRGEHKVEIRTTNAAGITATSSFPVYPFQVISDKPEVYLKADGSTLLNGDAIRSTPSLEIKVITDRTLYQVWFTLNGTRQQLTLTNPGFITTLFHQPTLTVGSNDIRVEAIDTDASNNLRYSTREALSLQVQTSGDAKIFGTPLNYPNPFNAGVENTTISYMLSIPSNVTLSIFDLSGSLIAKKSFSANQPGGLAGYNTVTWDGKTDGGSLVGNGIYIYLIIVDGKVVQNGKGKIAVFKR